MADLQPLRFQRGPFGEVFPLPLIEGMTGAECLEILEQDARDLGLPLEDVPTRGDSLVGMQQVAAVHVHSKLLCAALDGECTKPEAQGLRYLVVEQGLPMSVRPLLSEHDQYVTFVPIFQRVFEEQGNGGSPRKWRLGREGQGRSQIIEAETPGTALGIALDLTAEWYTQEDELLADRAKEVPRSITADYLARQLEVLQRNQDLPLANDWRIVRTRHDIFLLDMFLRQEGEQLLPLNRTIEAVPAVVARAVLLVAAASEQPIPCPQAPLLLELVQRAEARIPFPKAVGDDEIHTWQGEGEWEWTWKTKTPPASGEWGVIRRRGVKIAALEVGKKKSADGKREYVVVELVGKAEPFKGRKITEWDIGDFRALAGRRDRGAVAPLIWATWELFLAQERVASK